MDRFFQAGIARVAASLAMGLATCGFQIYAQSPEVVEVNVQSDYAHGLYYQTPAGVYITVGQKVRWRCGKYPHSVTAYHPDNGKELRIPEGARPFDEFLSDGVWDELEIFEWTFDKEGTYDYFCRLHEPLGEVGRIVVGAPGGPGEKPLGYSEAPAKPFGYTGPSLRSTVLSNVRRVFEYLNSQEIVRKKLIVFPVDEFRHGLSWHYLNDPIK
ncbi:MAG: hypothetical protein HY645_05360 [Acidobacteria bacterium]|nr:hypothetical protein [Acidobacteriota bacterium]